MKKGIVICLDSDELKAQTLKSTLQACDEIHNMSVVSIDKFCQNKLQMIKDLNPLYENFKKTIFDEPKYPNYGWYRKFEKRKF